jgi:ankyrin repeat protein
VIELLKKFASPALPDERGYFPMDLAGKFGHKEIVD